MTPEDFIEKYANKPGGAERAVYQMFLTELAQVLGVPTPDPAVGGALGDYQFEGPVKSEVVFGGSGTKRIDLYKRGCFILEAKQSQEKYAPADDVVTGDVTVPVTDLFGTVIGTSSAGGKRKPRYDRFMDDARIQAERYAHGLPDDHRSPPFLIVADIGRTFELYFDYGGNGRGYSFYPDQQNYRIPIEALRDEETRTLLRAIWADPASVDPRLKAAEVTRDIAERLSKVGKHLESEQHRIRPAAGALGVEASALFLMRLLFCMFAEDVGLLPKDSFKGFLEESKTRTEQWWRRGLADLWTSMNSPNQPDRYWAFGDTIVRYFNGNLFANSEIFDLDTGMRAELAVAASRDWKSVEPAIFGTLLEQVLSGTDRAKLGAHYTPRLYVQRLVNATIADVIDGEWQAVRAAARQAADAGNNDTAIAAITAFHRRLATLRILDPACGTGNFLYVALEYLLKLESEAIQLVTGLGGTLSPAVHPNQLLGLELNERAAVISELVLWIGWLRHRLANYPDVIGDPVLPTLTNINFGTHGGYDAVLRRTDTGEPDMANPMIPDWPVADFIIGNPPFIGGKDLRDKLGSDYAESLWRANPRVPKSADFVMQWWDRAAHILTTPGTALIRFGFVTTNSITQTFSRRVIEGYLADSPHPNPSPQGGGALSLILAIPDHPWTKATKDAAAVRIAMTVAQAGAHEGRLIEILSETGLDSDTPELKVSERRATIHADLSVGANVGGAVPLMANAGLGYRGVQLIGAGFIVTPREAESLGLGRRDGLAAHIRPYRHGRDLLQHSRGVMVIDLFGLDEKQVRTRFPEVFQHLLAKVKPERDANRRDSYKRNWWIHGEPRKDMRPALAGLSRYIATVETAKHRIFQFLDASILPDNKLIVIGCDDAFSFGVLHSEIHLRWTFANCGLIGMADFEAGHVYVKSKCFDPFPFPDATPQQRATIAELAEELDATRTAALAEVPGLTMTEIYNLVAWLRLQSPTERAKSPDKSSPERGGGARAASDGGVPLPDTMVGGSLSGGDGPLHHASHGPPPRSGEDLHARAIAARAGIIRQLHDQIDAAVADAYGWPADLAPAEIITRLVALNTARAAEEAAGHIRWLRPDYQIPRFSVK